MVQGHTITRFPKSYSFFGLLISTFVLGLGILIPIISLLGRTSWQSSVFFDSSLISVTEITVIQALSSTFFSVAFGLPLGWALGKSRSEGIRGSRFGFLLLSLPYGIPTITAAMTGIFFLGHHGVLAKWGINLEWAYTLKAVVMIHIVLNAPWTAFWIGQARSQIPIEPLEVAQTLGAGPWRKFKYVEWPYLKWTLFASSLQIFNLCVMSFALVLLLGGGPPVETLETVIYSRVRLGSFDLGGAVAAAAVQLGLTLVPWFLLLRLQSKELFFVTGGILPYEGREPIICSRKKLWIQLSLMLFCALPLLPFAFFLTETPWMRFFDSGFWADTVGPLMTSLKLAFGSSLLGLGVVLTAIGVGFNYPKTGVWVRIGLSLPGGISVLVLGLGAWIAYSRWIDPFEGSFFMILLLQTLLVLPLFTRTLWPLFLSLPRHKLEAAWTLGASPHQAFWKIEWPRWREPVLSSLALAAGAGIGEVAAVSLFSSENLTPLSLTILRAMGQYRFEDAHAISGLLLLTSMGVIASVLVYSQRNQRRSIGW